MFSHVTSFIQLFGFFVGMSNVVSYALFARKNRLGWPLALLAEGAWMAYAILLHQGLLLITCFVFAAVQVYGFLKWRD